MSGPTGYGGQSGPIGSIGTNSKLNFNSRTLALQRSDYDDSATLDCITTATSSGTNSMGIGSCATSYNAKSIVTGALNQ